MSKYGGSSAAVLLADGFNLIPSTILELTGPDLEAALVETTGLGDTWAQVLPPGMRKATLGVRGFFDDGTAGLQASLAAAENTSRVVSVGLEGNTLGQKFVGLAGAFGAKWSRAAQVGDLVRANVDYTVSGAVDDGGVILFPYASVTADVVSNTTSHDHGASSASGGAGFVHVVSYTGFANIIAKIRHSADDVTYADLITFTTFTASGAERSTVSGTVNRHLTVDINVTGAGSALVFIGFKRY